MKFRASFCDPFKPDIIELGEVEKDKIIDSFHRIPWKKLLDEMKTKKESEIHYSPSLEVENMENKNGLSVSAVDGKEWYIFFKRPKMVKKFFGLVERMDNDYMTDVTGQTVQDVLDCLNALIRNDLDFLEKKVK
jgi:hypothetical protein